MTRKTATLAAAAILVLLVCPSLSTVYAMENPTLEQQLATLEELEIRLRPGVTVEDLLFDLSREDYESQPYGPLLFAMGGSLSEAPYGPVSDDIWHFDTEAIDGHGSYVFIANEFRDLAGGKLPLEEIRDYADIKEGIAWLSFRLNQKDYRWDFVVNRDWVDPDVFDNFDALLREATDGRFRFTCYGLGQDMLIGIATPERLEELRDRTGLDIKWLVL